MGRVTLRKGRLAASAVLALLPVFLLAPDSRAGWGVGNGGDDLRLAFENARQYAVTVTLKLTDRSIAASVDPAVRAWISQNHVALSADIARARHVWLQDAEPTCAWTQLTAAADVQLSYPTCRQSVGSFDDAAQLLIHESTHHFGISDEQFADGVALAIYNAWHTGATAWVPTTMSGAPAPVTQAAAAWTGRQMLFQGGMAADGSVVNSAFLYDPARDLWTPLASAGAPARYHEEAVWTGSQLIVWGGYVLRAANVKVWQNSGALWDSATNVWTPLASPYGPAELNDLATDERSIQRLVWSGTDALIFGGAPVAGALTGGIYTPATKSWRPLPLAGAPVRIAGHSAVWAGDRMLIFGGFGTDRNDTNTGAAYVPATNQWLPTATAVGLTPRDGHSAVWTGSTMIVFGGTDGVPDFSGTGAMYDPTADAWTLIRTESVQARVAHSALWTGSEMLIYGGKAKKSQHVYFAGVSAFNPLSMSWRVVESPAAPAARALAGAVWTGDAMVVAGGLGDGDVPLASGGVFFP